MNCFMLDYLLENYLANSNVSSICAKQRLEVIC